MPLSKETSVLAKAPEGFPLNIIHFQFNLIYFHNITTTYPMKYCLFTEYQKCSVFPGFPEIFITAHYL